MQVNFEKKYKKIASRKEAPTKLFDIMFINFCIPLKSNKINSFSRVTEKIHLHSYKNK